MDEIKETEIDVEDVGTILKSGRLKSKKSLEEISSELCIRKIYLTALEEGDYETLPPIPYGVGYVRTYARYLGLSPERVVKLYKAAFQTEENDHEEELPPVPEVNNSNKWHIIIGVLALALMYGIWSLYDSKNSIKDEDVIKDEVIAIETDATAEVEEDTIDETSETKIQDESNTGAEEKVKDLTPDGAEEESSQQEEQKETTKIPEKGVYMEFTGETWIELKDKNRVYMQGVYHSGDVKSIEYRKNLFISVGRPQNMKLYINGVEKDVAAKKRKSNIPLDSI